jgi:Prp8 binding protein
MVVSASDDGSTKIWDARQKRETATLEHDFQVTSIALDVDNNLVYTGGIDNMITAWDIRQSKKTMALKGHTDTITCLSMHPKGTHLLSNSMDNSLRSWDIRPFCKENKRHCKTFTGATHNAEKGLLRANWSPDGSMVSAGSADRMVHIWDEYSSEELYLLPGHKGCVNTVIFHPKENVIASGASDKMVYVGELGQ